MQLRQVPGFLRNSKATNQIQASKSASDDSTSNQSSEMAYPQPHPSPVVSAENAPQVEVMEQLIADVMALLKQFLASTELRDQSAVQPVISSNTFDLGHTDGSPVGDNSPNIAPPAHWFSQETSLEGNNGTPSAMSFIRPDNLKVVSNSWRKQGAANRGQSFSITSDGLAHSGAPGRSISNSIFPTSDAAPITRVGGEYGNSAAIVSQVGGAASSIIKASGVVLNSTTQLPSIDSSQWSTRDGSNGPPFATPFVSGNVTKTGSSISTQVTGDTGSEAIFNGAIGTGFYQFNVNPQASTQKGDITTVFLYSGVGSNGNPKQQGFELDVEYNLVTSGTVTFGTWIDGVKYNEVTIPAPNGNQTIGFNIQNGYTQIGYINSDNTFVPVSETRDPRITPQLASHLQAMTNSWRLEGTPDTGQTSAITLSGFGRSDEPGQPIHAVQG